GFGDGEQFAIRRIGVGYDGKTESGQARTVATALAEELGAELETITVTGDGDAEPADPGDAADDLVARSGELDLLVVGSRGYGPVRHALLGSVTKKLMVAAACPVLVVPRGNNNNEQ